MKNVLTLMLLAALVFALALAGCEPEGPVYCDTSADCNPVEQCTFFYEYRAQICVHPCQTDEDCPSGQECVTGAACGECFDDGCFMCALSVNGCIP